MSTPNINWSLAPNEAGGWAWDEIGGPIWVSKPFAALGSTSSETAVVVVGPAPAFGCTTMPEPSWYERPTSPPEAMKRFVVFAYDTYYPGGGMSDLFGSFDTIEEASEAGRSCDFDHFEVVDRDTWEEIEVRP